MSFMFSRPLGRALVLAVSALSIVSVSASATTVVDRDEFSTTVDAGGGKLRTTLSSEPLNYQTDSGAWKPIDLQLEAQPDGTARPQSVDGDLAIPESLGSPVALEHDGRTASLRLLGASGDIDVTGAEATFEAAMPGVDVSYVARPYGVKETLTLATPMVPGSFVYELRASELWSASMDRGDVVLRDSAGAERYRISAPLAWDSAEDPAFTNALALSVSKLADGRWRVTLRPDAAWLTDTARVYPVTIDPDFSWSNGTTHFNGAQDCYLSGYTQANNTFCAQTYLQTGWYNRPYRSIFKFDIAAAIPSNATVSSAVFKAYAPPATPHIAMGHSLHTITSDWDSTATWNNRKAGTPWTSSGGGGDISTNPAYSSSSTSVQAYPAWYSWNAPLAAVQGWVDGSLPNYGFMLRSDNTGNIGNAYAWASTEASTSSQFPADSTKWPSLDVTWTGSADSQAPPTPDDAKIVDVDGLAESVTVGYTVPEDVAQANVSPSGTDRVEYRYSVGGGALSTWASTSDSEIQIEGVQEGSTLNLELRAVDAAGNMSAVSQSALAVWHEDDPPADPSEAAEYATDYGVSNAVASAWLSTQDKAHELAAQLETLPSGAHVAGYWFDNEARRLHVQVTDAAATAQIRLRASEMDMLDASVIDVVPYTQAQLEQKNAAAATQFASAIDAGLVLLTSDPIRSRLVWYVDESAGAPTVTAVQASAAGSNPEAVVRVVASGSLMPVEQAAKDTCVAWPDTPKEWAGDSTHHWVGCKGTPRGGTQIKNKTQTATRYCTGGFNAVAVANGAPRLLTAGHCIRGAGTSATWKASGNDPDGESTDQTVGDIGDYSVGGLKDEGWIKFTNPPDLISPIVYNRRSTDLGTVGKPISGANVALQVRSVGSPFPGEKVCMHGGRSGKSCGVVLQAFGSGERFVVNSCVGREGDSGSAVMHGNRAAGTYQGKWRPDAGAVQDLNRLADDLGDKRDISTTGCNATNAAQVQLVQGVEHVQRSLNSRVLTYRWRKTFKSPKTNTTAWVRAVATWDTKADVDLHVWGAAGGADLTLGHATSSGSPTLADGYVSANVKRYGPEQFVETTTAAGQDYAFGICYRGNPSGEEDRRTTVRLTLQARDGSSVTKDVVLTGQGSGAVLRPDNTSTRPEVDSAPVSTWCSGGTRTSTSAPVALTAPTLTNCLTSGCVVSPGTWSGSPTISYIRDACTSTAGPGPDCAWAWTAAPEVREDRQFYAGSCYNDTYDVTVVATNSSGQVYTPLRQVGPNVCIY